MSLLYRSITYLCSSWYPTNSAHHIAHHIAQTGELSLSTILTPNSSKAPTSRFMLKLSRKHFFKACIVELLAKCTSVAMVMTHHLTCVTDHWLPGNSLWGGAHSRRWATSAARRGVGLCRTNHIWIIQR